MIDHVAEIDQVLTEPPSPLAFRALCAALEGAGNPPELVARCAERLDAWPDALRAAPWSWLAALDAGLSKPAWSLVRSLTLKRQHVGLADPGLPDPRVHPELGGVTRLDLGWYPREDLTRFVETLAYWPNLRAVTVAGLTESDEAVIGALAAHPALARLESLDLIHLRENLFHFGKPPFRPERPLRLRHAGLRASDLVPLLRAGLLPELRSADVLVATVDEARDLAACPRLRGLERLAIGFRCGWDGRQPMWQPYFGNVITEDDDACTALFANADLTNLRRLGVRGIMMGLGREGLGARGVEAIVGSGVLRGLTALTLELLPIDDAAIARVIAAIDADRIEELTLANLVATDRTAAAFVTAGAFTRLRRLNLSRNRIGEPGARQLATEVSLPALSHLDLSGNPPGSPYYGKADIQPIGDAGVTAWANSPNAVNLTSLNLSTVGLGPAGLNALMSAGHLPNLSTLDLSANPIGGWADGPLWRVLRTVDLSNCGLGDDDIEAMTEAPALRAISLAYNNIGSPGARALAAWPTLPRLWEANLHDNVIGDDGLAALAASRAAQRLLELDLEQDCWNAHGRPYGSPLPSEVLDTASFPNLDAMFLGIVDEYHGARYTSGFPAKLAEELAAAGPSRPELVAFLTHLDLQEVDDPEGGSNRTDNDFRPGFTTGQAELLAAAREFAQRMIDGDIDWPPA